VALVALLMLLQPAAGMANPSVDQYVESVPTADGHLPAAGGGSGGRSADVPAAIRGRIRAEGGSDAATLEAVASSPTLGAPASGSGRARSGSTRAGAAGKPPSTAAAATVAAVDGGGNSIAVLVGGLILLTAVAGAVALARRRS
jgi:hypothetical protein